MMTATSRRTETAEERLEALVAACVGKTGGEPQRRGKETITRCPAHDDANPSLSVRIGDAGRLLLICRARECPTGDILAAIGWSMHDLFPPGQNGHAREPRNGRAVRPGFEDLQRAATWKANKIGGRLTGTHVYRDARGEPVFAVLRIRLADGSKDMPQMSRDPEGRWHFGYKAKDGRPLYRLPEVLQAPGDVVIQIHEGEAKVEIAEALGFVATCTSQGAGKARHHDLAALQGRHVAVFPDNDRPGREHVQDLARRAHAAGAASVRIVELPGLPEKGDIVDHVKARRAAGASDEAIHEEIHNAAAMAPLVEPGPIVEDEQPRRCKPATAADPRKPAVLLPGEQRDVRVGNDEFVAAVLKALPPGVLYRRGTILGELVGDRGDARFVPVTEHRVRTIVDSRVQLEYWLWNSKREDFELHYQPCLRDHANLILATAVQTPGLRELRAIVRYPVFGSDLELVKPGWNGRDGIYFDEPADLEGLEPCAERPLDVLDDLTVDFPFRDRAARENAYGMLLTALCAYAVSGNLPFHLVYASLERTGKGLLIDTLLGITVLGEPSVPTLQVGRTEEEREKRITAKIIEGATVVHFDNLPAEELLDSASLASLATSRTWSGRILGKSEMVQLPNTLIPVFSGNNPKTTGELTKRTVPIGLQPQDDRPQERTDFVHADIRAYAWERRRGTLAAAIAMVRDWRTAGCPRPAHVRMGGFEDWVRTIGGVLYHAGAKAWMSNYPTWVAAGDEFAADAAVLVPHWWRMRGPAEVTSADILAMVKHLGIYQRVLLGQETGATARLSRQVLMRLEDRPVAGWLVKRREYGSNSRYYLTQVDL